MLMHTMICEYLLRRLHIYETRVISMKFKMTRGMMYVIVSSSLLDLIASFNPLLIKNISYVMPSFKTTYTF